MASSSTRLLHRRLSCEAFISWAGKAESRRTELLVTDSGDYSGIPAVIALYVVGTILDQLSVKRFLLLLSILCIPLSPPPSPPFLSSSTPLV